MRLEQYLIEDEAQRLEMIETIKKECKPWLRLIKPILGSEKYFIRQSKRGNNFFVKVATRSDRRPLDSSKKVHNAFNKALEKRFGWRPRSEGVFVWPVSENPSIGYFFYPIGEFKYVWSPRVGDLFTTAVRNAVEIDIEEFVPTYTNRDLLDVFNTFPGRMFKSEVMFKCSQYYLVNRRYKELLRYNGLL